MWYRWSQWTVSYNSFLDVNNCPSFSSSAYENHLEDSRKAADVAFWRVKDGAIELLKPSQPRILVTKLGVRKSGSRSVGPTFVSISQEMPTIISVIVNICWLRITHIPWVGFPCFSFDGVLRGRFRVRTTTTVTYIVRTKLLCCFISNALADSDLHRTDCFVDCFIIFNFCAPISDFRSIYSVWIYIVSHCRLRNWIWDT